MIPDEKRPPVVPLDVEDTDETREPTGEDLRFNEEADSFELDPETNDREYDHPDPYDTLAPEGEDNNSTYDEQNPEASAEYRDKPGTLQGQLHELGAEVTDDQLAQLEDVDIRLASVPEDDRGDLDEEGYPKRDDAGGSGNPVTSGPDDGDYDEDGEPGEAEMPPFEDPHRDDERDPLGDKQIQSDDPTETTG